MEEAKNQEITKLQAALQEQLTQAQKANSQLTKELEDNKVALGQAAQVIKEVPPVEVFDAKVKKLTEENEKLQVSKELFPSVAVFFYDSNVKCHLGYDSHQRQYLGLRPLPIAALIFCFFQALLKSLERRSYEAQEEFAQAKKESEERLRRAEQAEIKITETQEALHRYVL